MHWTEIGLTTTVIGMGVVFSVLIFLSFVTWLLVKIVDDSSVNKKPKSDTNFTPSQEIAVASVPAAKIDDGIDAKTVAIIMAAVTAASGVVQNNLKFTAIRRSNAYHSDWADHGTHAIINSRQSF